MSAIQPFNTTDILRDLAGRYFGEKKPPNPTTSQITLIYAKFGEQNRQWGDLLDAGKSIEIPVRDLLDRLQTGSTQQAKSSFEILSTQAKPLLQRSDELEQAAGAVYEASKTSQEQALASLKSAWMAKNPDKHAISQADAICTSSAEELAKQKKPRETVNSDLEGIQWRTYLALPNKSDIPSSSITPSMRQKMGSSGG